MSDPPRGVAAAAKQSWVIWICPPFSCGGHAALLHYNETMILAYHVIFGAYGFWLPNDPRGSGSDKVWAEHLKSFGDATKVNTRHSVADKSHDRRTRIEAKRNLLYPAVKFNGLQARAVARGIGDVSATLKLGIYACCVMPDHVHLVIARHQKTIETITGFMKRGATRKLTEEGTHPLADYRSKRGRVPSPWGRGGWYVYLNTPDRVNRAIEYVDANPVKAGMKRQAWTFVKPLDASRGRDG